MNLDSDWHSSSCTPIHVNTQAGDLALNSGINSWLVAVGLVQIKRFEDGCWTNSLIRLDWLWSNSCAAEMSPRVARSIRVLPEPPSTENRGLVYGLRGTGSVPIDEIAFISLVSRVAPPLRWTSLVVCGGKILLIRRLSNGNRNETASITGIGFHLLFFWRFNRATVSQIVTSGGDGSGQLCGSKVLINKVPILANS